MPATSFHASVPVDAATGLIDWVAVADLPAHKREAVLVNLTGIAPEADAYGYVTGDSRDANGRREIPVDLTCGATASLVESLHAGRTYSAGADSTLMHAPRLSNVLHDAAHSVSSIREALVLTALMHADVWTSDRGNGRRVKATALAREVVGSDDSTSTRHVSTALAHAVDRMAGDLADEIDRTEADARRVVLAHLAADLTADTLRRDVPVVVTGGRGDADSLTAVSERTPRREARAAREAAREADTDRARFIGRVSPETPEESPVAVSSLPDAVVAVYGTESNMRAVVARFRVLRDAADRAASLDAAVARDKRRQAREAQTATPTATTTRAPRAARVTAPAPTAGRDRLASLRRR